MRGSPPLRVHEGASAALAHAARSRFEKTRNVVPLIGALDQRAQETRRKVARGRHPTITVNTSNIEVLRDLLEPSNSDPLTKPRFEHPDVAARPDSQSVREILLRESAVHPRMPNEAPYLLRRTLRRHRHRQPFPATPCDRRSEPNLARPGGPKLKDGNRRLAAIQEIRTAASTLRALYERRLTAMGSRELVR